MQATESANGPTAPANDQMRFNLMALDGLFEVKDIHGIPAQARALGLHRGYWTRIRNGETVPAAPVIIRVARFLGVPVESIYADTK